MNWILNYNKVVDLLNYNKLLYLSKIRVLLINKKKNILIKKIENCIDFVFMVHVGGNNDEKK